MKKSNYQFKIGHCNTKSLSSHSFFQVNKNHKSCQGCWMLGGIPPNPNIILESHLFFFKKERNIQSEGVDAEGFADRKSREALESESLRLWRTPELKNTTTHNVKLPNLTKNQWEQRHLKIKHTKPKKKNKFKEKEKNINRKQPELSKLWTNKQGSEIHTHKIHTLLQWTIRPRINFHKSRKGTLYS